MKRAILIIAVVTTGLSGCAGFLPNQSDPCTDPDEVRVAWAGLSLGLTEILHAALCPDRTPYAETLPSKETLQQRATELNVESGPQEQYEVGSALRWRGEFELGYRLICFSAHQRYHYAQNWMARRFHFGFPPVETDLVQAYKWYQIAFYGSEYADSKRAELTLKMTPAEIVEAERLVAEWEPNPAECETIGAQAEN